MAVGEYTTPSAVIADPPLAVTLPSNPHAVELPYMSNEVMAGADITRIVMPYQY